MGLYEDIINRQATIAQKQKEMTEKQAELESMQTQIAYEQSVLDDIIKKFKEQEETEVKFPEVGDKYFVLRSTDRTPTIFSYNNDKWDEYWISRGLFGRTEAELSFKHERLKIFAELERCGGIFEVRRSIQNEEVYYLGTGGSDIHINIGYGYWTIPVMWFPTKEQAQKAIDNIGKDRLLKYWFNVGCRNEKL